MKKILLLHDEARRPTQLLQNALPAKFPVRETEAVAVDDVLKACRAAEPDCRVHAIGNWRVGGRLAAPRN